VRLLSVASEVFPLVKTGGLADVAGALPRALSEYGVETRTLLPGYPAVLAALSDAEPALRIGDLFGGSATVLTAAVDGLQTLVIDAPHLYSRPGGIYGWPDDAIRFAALARVAADIGMGALPGFLPDIVHSHDWQTGLTPAYLRYDGRRAPGTVMTVHNLAFQGQFPPNLLGVLGLPASAYTMEGVEYYGEISFLKAGLQLADRITTVSPTYAAEIQSPALGMGMDGLLRHRAAVFSGILNGIDTEVWNPQTDTAIVETFSVDELGGRPANKAGLQEHFDLPVEPSLPLFGIITRLSWQKGVDLITAAVPDLIALGAQLVVLGAGDFDQEVAVGGLRDRYSETVAVRIGYDEALAHLIQAGADAIVVPSRFEPCGLTQLCALRYGAIPVVARTGGLVDTVIDASPVALAAGVATGVQFAAGSVEMVAAALRRTVGLHADRTAWRQMQANAMHTDVSWRDPARRYATLYRGLLR
jgi:starch synthase